MRQSDKKRWLADERGNATIETVLWLPVYVFFLTLVFDTSMTFFNQSQILRLLQDENRAFATGQVRDLEETTARIRARIEQLGGDPEVSTVVSGNVIRSEVLVRAGDLGGVGLLGLIANLDLRLASQHLVEG